MYLDIFKRMNQVAVIKSGAGLNYKGAIQKWRDNGFTVKCQPGGFALVCK